MKTILLSIALLCTIITASAEKTIQTHARLGSASTCSGTGFCTIKTEAMAAGEPDVPMTLTLSDDGSTLSIFISIDDEESVPSAILSNLRAGRFVMSEPYALERSVSLALGSNASITIPAGTFSVSHSDIGYTISIATE